MVLVPLQHAHSALHRLLHSPTRLLQLRWCFKWTYLFASLTTLRSAKTAVFALSTFISSRIFFWLHLELLQLSLQQWWCKGYAVADERQKRQTFNINFYIAFPFYIMKGSRNAAVKGFGEFECSCQTPFMMFKWLRCSSISELPCRSVLLWNPHNPDLHRISSVR